MRNFYILFILLFLFFVPAKGQRYLYPVFDSVVVQSDIAYGSNLNFKGDTLTLLLDVYHPYGDTLLQRPILILAHGGSFATGSKTAGDIVSICMRLAKIGYVVVSFDYRLGADILSGRPLEQEFQMAAWRATQDNRAAVRFFNKSILNGNPYRIDSTQIYGGGISAGAVMALHMNFLDRPAKISGTLIDTSIVGGIEGNSGNAGYPWRQKGIVNLCGAMGSAQWMNDNKSVSLCNMHGNWDATVPYKTDQFKFLGANVMLVQGSFSIDSAANQMGMDSRLYTFNEAGHIPFSGNTAAQMAYMDTTIQYVARYLYRHVTGKIPDQIEKISLVENQIQVFPNPVENLLQINLGQRKNCLLVLKDIQGKTLFETKQYLPKETLDMQNMPSGIYILQIRDQDQTFFQKIIHP